MLFRGSVIEKSFGLHFRKITEKHRVSIHFVLNRNIKIRDPSHWQRSKLENEIKLSFLHYLKIHTLSVDEDEDALTFKLFSSPLVLRLFFVTSTFEASFETSLRLARISGDIEAGDV